MAKTTSTIFDGKKGATTWERKLRKKKKLSLKKKGENLNGIIQEDTRTRASRYI